MRSIFPFARAAVVAALVADLSGCGGDASGRQVSRGARDGTGSRPVLEYQTLGAPCDLVPRAEVERVLGKLAGAPRLGRSAETPVPDDQGAACVYPVEGEGGATREVAIDIALDGSAGFEQGMGMLGEKIAQEMGTDHDKAATPRKPSGGWDYADATPTLTVWRRGHLAIEIGGQILGMPTKRLDTLAALVRDRIPDLPFAASLADPNAAGSEPDPCALLSRTEAESVLGELTAPPYRSLESSALADGEGPSCSYYTKGHRVLVLTPTRIDGKMLFGMASGIGGLITSMLGVGGSSADSLDGPWDQATSGVTGSLLFLKGDQMLELHYRTSATDGTGATRLARAAVARL